MKKLHFLCILILIAMLALAGCGGSEPPPEEDPEEDVASLFQKGREVEDLYYELYIEGPGMESEGKIWLSKNKMKMEMTVADQTSINIVDGDEKVIFLYMPAENTAIRMPLSEGEEDIAESPGDFLEYDESLVTLGDTVILNGVECQKVTVQDESMITMWIHKEYGLPVRVEVGTGEDMMVWEFRNISTDPIPADTFNLPEGVNIINT